MDFNFIVPPVLAINSICIDLGSAMDKEEAGNSCEHDFSPRGYTDEMPVNGIRSRAPPPLNGKNGELKKKHGELHVPEFIWRRCQKCQLEMVFDRASEFQLNGMEESINSNGDTGDSFKEKPNSSDDLGSAMDKGETGNSREHDFNLIVPPVLAINSICIDLGSAMDKEEAGNSCEHDFSPRPPPLIRKKSKLKKKRGELHVPKFIWRRCRKCQLEVVVDCTSELRLNRMEESSNSNGDKGDSFKIKGILQLTKQK